MKFQVAAPTLKSIDGLQHELLLLAHFADERPPRGVGGLVDWRLNGLFSQMVLSGRLTGQWGEQLLYPQKKRLAVPQLIYFGLGDRQEYGKERFQAVTRRMFQTIVGLGCRSFATVLPGRDGIKLFPGQLIEIWLHEFGKMLDKTGTCVSQYDVLLLEPPAIQAEINEPLALFSRTFPAR